MRFYHLTSSTISEVVCSADDFYAGKVVSAFWACPDFSWLEWTAWQGAWDEEEFQDSLEFLKGNANVYSLDVDMDQVLIVESELDARLVFLKYGFVYDTGFDSKREAIDWSKVAEDYKAIFIAFSPRGHYSRERDGGLEWLSGYDVSSIAIWDASIIRSIQLYTE